MRNNLVFVLGLILVLFISCKSDYEKLVHEEMQKEEIHEELIFNLKMGQSRKEFYSECWELNKNAIINQGPSNDNVHYKIPKTEFPDSNQVEMLFFGIFDEDLIMHGLRQRFYYSGWAPWNKDLQSDKLIEKVKLYYENKYPGNEFIPLDLKLGDEVLSYVKVDGNRQITVYQRDPKEVGGKIEDLRYKLKK